MVLIGNYTVLAKNPGRSVGGGATGLGMNRDDWNKPSFRGHFTSDSWDKKSSMPEGTRPPYSWSLPLEAGGLASHGTIAGSSSFTANGTLGLNAGASLAGTSTFIADGTMVIQAAAALIGTGVLAADVIGVLQAAANLTGTGTISSALLNAVVDIVASLSGSGVLAANVTGAIQASADLIGSGSLVANIAGAVQAVAALTGVGTLSADITGRYDMFANLSGSGSLVADLRALGHVVAALTGTGTIAASLTGIGNMSADVTPFTALSPESLAAAVWNALAADFNDVGTMGEKLNDAGSGSNPWTEVIEGAYTAAEILRIIVAAAAGVVSGAETTTITIKGLDGATDRIIATVTTDGNRTAVAVDGS